MPVPVPSPIRSQLDPGLPVTNANQQQDPPVDELPLRSPFANLPFIEPGITKALDGPVPGAVFPHRVDGHHDNRRVLLVVGGELDLVKLLFLCFVKQLGIISCGIIFGWRSRDLDSRKAKILFLGILGGRLASGLVLLRRRLIRLLGGSLVLLRGRLGRFGIFLADRGCREERKEERYRGTANQMD